MVVNEIGVSILYHSIFGMMFSVAIDRYWFTYVVLLAII
jgi:hypothetical protein